ncbi:hypothetical protein [Labrys neptuniae]
MFVNLTRGAAREKPDQFDQPAVRNGVTAFQSQFRLDEPMYTGML